MKYLVEFERVGRNHLVPDLEVEGSEQDLVDEVISYCSQYLASRGFDVTIILEDGVGWIDGGRFGEFSVKELDGVSRTDA